MIGSARPSYHECKCLPKWSWPLAGREPNSVVVGDSSGVFFTHQASSCGFGRPSFLRKVARCALWVCGYANGFVASKWFPWRGAGAT